MDKEKLLQRLSTTLEDAYKSFCHAAMMEVRKSYGITPAVLKIEKPACTKNSSKNFSSS